MAEYIQIGVTALRDPKTGEILESVPLYIREEDRKAEARAEIKMDGIIGEMAAAFGKYIAVLSGGRLHHEGDDRENG